MSEAGNEPSRPDKRVVLRFWLVLWAAVFVAVTGSGAGFGPFLVLLPILALCFANAYPVSSLLVSGLCPRLLRSAGFALVWWSAYCLALLLLGLRTFVL